MKALAGMERGLVHSAFRGVRVRCRVEMLANPFHTLADSLSVQCRPPARCR